MTTTAKDWRTLPAGRELDALVAERVLGAMIHEGQHDDYMTLPGERPISDQRPVPPYSTDIAAAWQVVEAFNNGAHAWRYPDFVNASAALVSGGWQTFAGWFFSRTPSDAALAICRAALAATEAR